jgi:hypothetical protein
MAITALGSTRIEPSADVCDITGLGHCNFQFYDNAAGHYFSPATLLACRRWHPNFGKAKSRRQSTSTPQRITGVSGLANCAGSQSGLPLEGVSTRDDREAFGAMFANGCPWRVGYCDAA